MKKPKNILVSFSGGLDSTYLVYKALKEGHLVTGIYTTIRNNEKKVKVEKHQIDMLNAYFQQEFPRQFKYEYGIDIMVYGYCDLHLKQITIWLMSLLYHGSKYDEVQIGAVMNDDLVSYINDLKNIWESFKPLSNDLPKITFPLIKTPKWEVVEKLPQQYKDLVVYCENPVIIKKTKKKLIYENCGICNPCERYKFESKKWSFEYGQITNLIPDIERYKEEVIKENKRCGERNEWVETLLNSFKK